jgi:hypothetical protein
MNLSDVKMLIINFSTLAISMTNVDMILKSVLLIITIFYTLHKWYFEAKRKRKEKKENKPKDYCRKCSPKKK